MQPTREKEYTVENLKRSCGLPLTKYLHFFLLTDSNKGSFVRVGNGASNTIGRASRWFGRLTVRWEGRERPARMWPGEELLGSRPRAWVRCGTWVFVQVDTSNY